MSFIEQHQQLKELFDISKQEINIPGSNTIIKNLGFKSEGPLPDSLSAIYEDSSITENIEFRYPVVIPENSRKRKNAIIYLHGLNERTWNKHLPGAKYLAEKTGKAVILFPLSFHINRGLPEWTDKRKMADLLEKRKQKYPMVEDATVINLALSERLTANPERFFISGLQSAMDLIHLLKDIQDGRHPLFEQDTQVDIFAYSISCMMLQSLMISNPDNILGRSKIVFFAGGSLFSQLHGISKYIMDSVAFLSIRNFYLENIKRRNRHDTGIQPWIRENKFGQAFRAIIAPDVLKNIREKSVDYFRNNLMIIALQEDKVNPVEGIRQCMGEKFINTDKFKILHFPYEYTHENPFPVLYLKNDELVEKAFLSVFNQTLHFFEKRN